MYFMGGAAMTPRKAGSESQSAREQAASHPTLGPASAVMFGSTPNDAVSNRAGNPPAPPPCEACGHPQRALSVAVSWTHAFNLHDEIRALEEELDYLVAAAIHRALDGEGK